MMVQARSNPDLKWEFLVQEGPPQSVLVRLRRAVRLVRLQYECQYDCGFLKSVELTVAGRRAVSSARGRSPTGGRTVPKAGEQIGPEHGQQKAVASALCSGTPQPAAKQRAHVPEQGSPPLYFRSACSGTRLTTRRASIGQGIKYHLRVCKCPLRPCRLLLPSLLFVRRRHLGGADGGGQGQCAHAPQCKHTRRPTTLPPHDVHHPRRRLTPPHLHRYSRLAVGAGELSAVSGL